MGFEGDCNNDMTMFRDGKTCTVYVFTQSGPWVLE